MSMALFKTRKPRGFHYTPRFYDPEREKWQKVEEDAKRRLGIIPPKEFKPEDIRGKFVEETKHLKKRKEKGQKLKSGHLLLGLAVLILLMYWVLS